VSRGRCLCRRQARNLMHPVGDRYAARQFDTDRLTTLRPAGRQCALHRATQICRSAYQPPAGSGAAGPGPGRGRARATGSDPERRAFSTDSAHDRLGGGAGVCGAVRKPRSEVSAWSSGVPSGVPPFTATGGVCPTSGQRCGESPQVRPSCTASKRSAAKPRGRTARPERGQVPRQRHPATDQLIVQRCPGDCGLRLAGNPAGHQPAAVSSVRCTHAGSIERWDPDPREARHQEVPGLHLQQPQRWSARRC
jgi:hypothetical protein